MDISQQILRAVNDHGVMLVHDRVLPSVTQLVVGEPIAGSWWSHPMANAIYNALGELDGQVATVKLVRKKDTLVAQRLWVDLVDIGMAPTDVQFRDLKPEDLVLLSEINIAGEPVIVDRDRRDAAKDLASRLLVYATDVHTDSGHHVKAYSSWQLWARDNHVVASGDAAQARRRFDVLVAGWPSPGRSKLLPW